MIVRLQDESCDFFMMPPLRAGRASKACESCRKQKTRCYASDNARGICLRCETLSQPCSLEYVGTYVRLASPVQRHERVNTERSPVGRSRLTSVDERYHFPVLAAAPCLVDKTPRLERLESTVQTLVRRLEASNGVVSARSIPDRHPPRILARTSSEDQDQDQDQAPVFWIRDAAADAGVQSPQQVQARPQQHSDVISTGLVALSTAHSLLSLYVLAASSLVRRDRKGGKV